MKAKRLFLTMGMALCGGIAAAQITIRTDGVNIGGGLDVGSSKIIMTRPLSITDLSLSNADFGSMTVSPQGVEILKPVEIWPYTLQQTDGQGLSLGYGTYGLKLGLSGVASQPQSAPGVDVNPGFGFEGAAAYLQPLTHLGVDLGSASTRFRYLYVKEVRATGSSYVSDERYKENVRGLGASTPLLENLRPVSFDFKADGQTGDTTGLKGKVGFIAQEEREVMPGLVGYIPEADMYTLNYVGMIPYLVKAFQEERREVRELQEENRNLAQEVEDLREELDAMKVMLEAVQAALQPGTKAAQGSASNEGSDDKSGQSGCKLYQNQPNPFTETTVIRYELPQGTRGASLQVFDMQGRRVMEKALPQGVEAGQTEIAGNTLQPGMYTYSLVVEGRVMDSRKMVVTE